MENIKLAHQNLTAAFDKLGEKIEQFEEFKSNERRKVTQLLEFMDNNDLFESLRESVIQRFEYCTDLLWKYLKKYLEAVIKAPEVNGPKPVLKAACQAKLISEADTEILLRALDSRNLTSHLYKEEVANRISTEIPAYYKIMQKYVEKLTVN
jgi:nucleotidyltransferase substrate binding protein (TIGR01987 family)